MMILKIPNEYVKLVMLGLELHLSLRYAYLTRVELLLHVLLLLTRVVDLELYLHSVAVSLLYGALLFLESEGHVLQLELV
jgi:hypothetical protein